MKAFNMFMECATLVLPYDRQLKEITKILKKFLRVSYEIILKNVQLNFLPFFNSLEKLF